MNKSCQMKQERQQNLHLSSNKPTKPKSRAASLRKLAMGWMILQTFLMTTPVLAQKADNELSYSQFLKKLENGEITKVELDETTSRARVTLKGQEKGELTKEVILFNDNRALTAKIREQKNVEFNKVESIDRSATVNVLVNLIVIFVLLAGLIAIVKRSANASGQAFSFGKSKARFQMEAKTGIKFEDVAGIEEAKEELQEVVTFLKEPERFTAVGAKIPRGVLLVGPPGTGKTLLGQSDCW